VSDGFRPQGAFQTPGSVASTLTGVIRLPSTQIRYGRVARSAKKPAVGWVRSQKPVLDTDTIKKYLILLGFFFEDDGGSVSPLGPSPAGRRTEACDAGYGPAIAPFRDGLLAKVGLPADFNPALTKRLGTRIVQALAGQLGAELTRQESTGGTHLTLVVPLHAAAN
jgi:hypothetical protein